MRCLALAEELAEAGWRIVFATIAETVANVPALAIEGFATEILLDETNETEVLARHFESGVDLLVVDHYGRNAMFERQCRAFARRILVLDDATGRDHDCDLLLDSAAADPAAYRTRVPPHTQLLCGPAFALVRRTFLAHRRAALARRDGRPVENILVSLGATDPANATSLVLDALEDVIGDTTITIVLSSRAPHIDEVRERATEQIRLMTDVADMAELMVEADLAVGGAGASAFERAVLGLPSVLATVADNQRGVCRILADAGAALDGGALDNELTARLSALAGGLMKDGVARVRMAKAASVLVDGHGIRRVMAALAGDTMASGGARVRLRLADAGDEAWLLDLQREPATRRYARNPAAPSLDEHRRWMARMLNDPNVWLLVAEIDGARAGMVRLDRLDEAPRYEVSIAVRADYQNRGVASAALALARRLKPRAVLDAEILPANSASISLFRRAGFVHDAGDRYRSWPDE